MFNRLDVICCCIYLYLKVHFITGSCPDINFKKNNEIAFNDFVNKQYGYTKCKKGCPLGLYGCKCNYICALDHLGCPYGCDQSYGLCKKCSHCAGGSDNCVGKRDIYDIPVYKCKSGCDDGWFGDKCDKMCSEISNVKNCQKCFRFSFTYYKCSECMPGWYIDISRVFKYTSNDQELVLNTDTAQICRLCSDGCLSCETKFTCHSKTGVCKYGCKDKYVGEKCDNKCIVENCLMCHPERSSECVQCRQGFYGNNCSETCNINCVNKTCDVITGNCLLGCKSGWAGQQCNFSCSEEKCQRCFDNENGACESCSEEFVRDNCSQSSFTYSNVSKGNHELGIKFSWLIISVVVSSGIFFIVVLLLIVHTISRKRYRKRRRTLVADRRSKVLQKTNIDIYS